MKSLVIMTRVPIKGKTKTRLIGDYSAQQAALLHQCFLKDIALEVIKLATSVDLFVSYGKEGDTQILKDIFTKEFQFFLQEGDNLGDKMANIFRRMFLQGYTKVILIGSDAPQISHRVFLSAFNALSHFDLALGPTLDGGYYLIGMKEFFYEVFQQHICWGSSKVFKDTIRELHGKKVFLLTKELDLDTAECLKKFFIIAKQRNNSKNTTRYLTKLWKK